MARHRTGKNKMQKRNKNFLDRARRITTPGNPSQKAPTPFVPAASPPEAPKKKKRCNLFRFLNFQYDLEKD